MARGKPWLKMWVESLDDPKMLRLTMAEEASWWRLLRLAQRCDVGGSLVTSSGSPLTTNEIATCLHITSPDDMATFKSMLRKMETEGSICWNNEALHIVHFAERQQMVPSETPDAVRERVRLFRERHRVTTNPLPAVTPPVSSPLEPPFSKEKENTYIEGEEEKSRYVTGETPLRQTPSNVQSVTDTSPSNVQSVTGTLPTPRQGIESKADAPSGKPKRLTTSQGVKQPYGEGQNVFLYDNELAKLKERFGEEVTRDKIEALSVYKGSKGKKYASDYLTILDWDRRDKKDGPGSGQPGRRADPYKRPSSKGHTADEYQAGLERWNRRQGAGDDAV